MVIFDYDISRWTLREAISAMLGVQQLEKLHEHVQSGRVKASRSGGWNWPTHCAPR